MQIEVNGTTDKKGEQWLVLSAVMHVNYDVPMTVHATIIK